ncbi:MAG: site-specific integrase [Pseudomonadota bacterium]
MPRKRPDEPRLIKNRGKWTIEYFDGNRRRRASTGTDDPTLARQALADFVAALDGRPELPTVAAALDAYLADRRDINVAWRRSKEASVALKEGLGELRIDQVTQGEWRRYASNRRVKPHWRLKGAKRRTAVNTARPVAPDTLKREFNTLRAALNLAVKLDWVEKVPTLATPPSSAPRHRYLTKEQARSLFESAKSPHVRLFIAIALGTGARSRSILDLTWDRVDFDRGRIDFQEPGRPVTKKRRSVVPMNGQVRNLLLEAQAAAQTDYVVEWEGNRVKSGIRWPFAKAVARAKLPTDVTPHVLKHTAASWLAMEGIPLSQAADMLATDEATLRRVYRKFDPDYLAPAADALQF